ncbi:MAG: hypothetical protein M3320_00240 [Actinomycetota bacterium]|nr:hypothetical protein [Actinomycetota bacterium]MDQ5807085.1 hypothetical protein [Actinomycetota bacterium]
MVRRTLSGFERLVVEAALAGEELADVEDAPDEERVIDGGLVREILSGIYGPPHWRGLRVSGITIRGDVDLSYCEWRGRLQLDDCTILGDVDLTYARGSGQIVLDRSTMGSVVAANCELTGSLQIRRATVAGGFSGVGMSVAGVLNLDRSTFRAPADFPNRSAVGLYRAKLDDLYMTRTTLEGGLFANGVTVRRNVRLSGVRAQTRDALDLETGPDTGSGAAISLVGAEVGGAIYLYSEALATDPPDLQGTLNLNRVRCSTLRARPVDFASLHVTVDHLSYERLHGMTPREWLDVLERTENLETQPYRQLAAVCDAVGNFSDARTTRIALQRRLDRDGELRGWHAVQRKLLRWSVAYGYRPGRAVVGLVLVSAIAAAILIAFDDFMVASDSVRGSGRGFESAVDAATFALDSLVPFAQLEVTSRWTTDPDGGMQFAALTLFVLLKGVAWALAALALAATTGLVRNE